MFRLHDRLQNGIEVPRIAPLKESGAGRPVWSIMIPTYNRTDYLVKTLSSVLAYDRGPDSMQIEVVDNCSDDPAIQEIVLDIGQGRIGFHRHAENLGMVGNWNSCIERARGEWVHILHDDDFLDGDYYSALEGFTAEHKEVLAVACRGVSVDPDDRWLEIMYSPETMKDTGVFDNARDELARRCWFIAPSVVVRRRAYEEHGGFSPSFSLVSDWEMWFRLSAHGSFGYLWHPYLRYREHVGSATNETLRDGRFFREIDYFLDRALKELPHCEKGIKQTRKMYSKMARRLYFELVKLKDFDNAKQAAFWCHTFLPRWKNYWLLKKSQRL